MSSGRRYYRSNRNGTVMILFAMLIFLVMAIGGMVIDLGLARVTQRQMQSAVDSAALEAMRGHDLQTLGDANGETDRRSNASNMVSWTFQDINPPTSQETNLAVGPSLSFEGGVGDPALGASQHLTVPDQHTYPPLQNNLNNAPNGDMVAGIYSNDPLASHAESPDYERSDFTVDPNGTSFLVRMRRTNEKIDGASVGPPLPLLFTRGSLSQLPRNNGISVRATAIADGRPALYVGSLQDSDQPQPAPFALAISDWESNVDSAAGKNIQVADHAVGDPLNDTGDTSPLPDGRWYIPLYGSIAGTAGNYILGFGVGQVTGGSLTQLHNFYGTHNVSASPAAILQQLKTLANAGADLNDLFKSISMLGAPSGTPPTRIALLAPVLVSSTGPAILPSN